jgi:hypothetical protein
VANKGRGERRSPHKSEIRKRGKGYQAMKRMGNRLAVLTVAVCLFVSIGVTNKSFAQILWVASVDAQMGVLPVYAEPTANSAMVGSLQRCDRVILTGLEKDSFVEISQPIAGWAPANLLGEYSCSQGSVVPVEPTEIVSAPIGVAYGPYFHHRHHWRHRHHHRHHFGHHPGGHHPRHHVGHHRGHHSGHLAGGHLASRHVAGGHRGRR